MSPARKRIAADTAAAMPLSPSSEHWKTKAEPTGFVLTSVLTRPVSQFISGVFTYEKRGGRESNPRIAVLQTATLPLGYPAICAGANNIVIAALVSTRESFWSQAPTVDTYVFAAANASRTSVI